MLPDGLGDPRREFGSDPSDGTDPRAFVVSPNLTRRHLSESQQAIFAVKLAKMKRGGDRRSNEAAEMLNVSEPCIRRANKVENQGGRVAI